MLKVEKCFHFPELQYDEPKQKFDVWVTKVLDMKKDLHYSSRSGEGSLFKVSYHFLAQFLIILIWYYNLELNCSVDLQIGTSILGRCYHAFLLVRTFSMCFSTLLMTFCCIYPWFSCPKRSKPYTRNDRPEMVQVCSEEGLLQVLCLFRCW